MFCYSFGAILLWLNVLSAAALQYEQEPKGSSNAMLVYTSCMSWFLLEYMFFEHVHLYTYDIFRERLGKCMVMRAWMCVSACAKRLQTHVQHYVIVGAYHWTQSLEKSGAESSFTAANRYSMLTCMRAHTRARTRKHAQKASKSRGAASAGTRFSTTLVFGLLWMPRLI